MPPAADCAHAGSLVALQRHPYAVRLGTISNVDNAQGTFEFLPNPLVVFVSARHRHLSSVTCPIANLTLAAHASVLYPLILAAIFTASNGRFKIAFIDALYVCISAVTGTGLTTIDLSSLTAWQQTILVILEITGNQVSATHLGTPRESANDTSLHVGVRFLDRRLRAKVRPLALQDADRIQKAMQVLFSNTTGPCSRSRTREGLGAARDPPERSLRQTAQGFGTPTVTPFGAAAARAPRASRHATHLHQAYPHRHGAAC